jgi:hypothetical protein
MLHPPNSPACVDQLTQIAQPETLVFFFALKHRLYRLLSTIRRQKETKDIA